MTLNELRQMIRVSVKRQIAEAAKSSTSPPDTFTKFRNVFSTALKAAGAPEDLVDEASDTSYEGGPVFGAMWDAWSNIESEMRGIKNPVDRRDEWLGMVEYYVHDAVLDMVGGFLDPMNYEPGRRVKKIDAPALAKKVVAVMKGEKVSAAPPSPTDKMAVASAIKKDLESEGSKVTVEEMSKTSVNVRVLVPSKKRAMLDQVTLYCDEVMKKLGFDSSLKGELTGEDEDVMIDYEGDRLEAFLTTDPKGVEIVIKTR
jgi:hypothetical protein